MSKLNPKLLARLFPATVGAKKLTPRAFLQQLSHAGITYSVEWGRVSLSGGYPQERERLIGILQGNPDLEARLILGAAVHDPGIMESIEERASIRWVDGYSDSLYDAVMCNIRPVEETREYTDKPDPEQASFLRRMGFPEEHIMDREHCPGVWVKRKPITNWDAEKRKYRL